MHHKNPRRLRRPHIWVCPAHMPYKGITPPRNWRHKKFEIHIWSWQPSRRSMTHGKRIPRTPTTKYGPPSLDSSHSAVPSARWLKTEGWHPYWYVFTNYSPTPDLISHELKKLKRSKIWNKIHNLLTYVSLVFIMYQFIYNPRVKSIKMLILFENPLISSSIHIYPPFFFHYYRFNENQDLC